MKLLPEEFRTTINGGFMSVEDVTGKPIASIDLRWVSNSLINGTSVPKFHRCLAGVAISHLLATMGSGRLSAIRDDGLAAVAKVIEQSVGDHQ